MTQEYSSSNRCHPALSVTCRAARRPGYFYWNVFLVMVGVFYSLLDKVAPSNDICQSVSANKGLNLSTALILIIPQLWYWLLGLQFFISALSFATFAVSPELPQNRLQLSFTLLLTSVAFKFVINQSLPKISYLTYMVGTLFIRLIIAIRYKILNDLLIKLYIMLPCCFSSVSATNHIFFLFLFQLCIFYWCCNSDLVLMWPTLR